MIEFFFKIWANIYAYCTDFIINLANLTELSYYEINALIFCFFWPLVTFFLILFYTTQKTRFYLLKSKKK